MKRDMKLSTAILFWCIGMAFLMWFMTLENPAEYMHNKVNLLVEALEEVGDD